MQIENSDAALPSLSAFQNSKYLANISTSEQEINILLRNVDLSKACGSDGIGNFILKICAEYIADPLCHIINESLLQGVYPSLWKFANVIPIFKKDDCQSKVNYRPVSLLACLSKISEKIVFIRLYNFLLDINFLNPFQSGFRPGDSTVNQLILITHKIYEALEQGKEVRLSFIRKNHPMVFSTKRQKPLHPQLKYDNQIIESVSNHKHLGVTLSSSLSWRTHVFNIYEKASKRLNLLKGLKFRINRANLDNLYKALIRPILEYSNVLWDNCSLSECDLIESIQYESARVVTGAMKGTSRTRLLEELSWEDMKTRRSMHKLVLYYKIVNNLTPNYLSDLLPQTVQQRSGLLLRNSENITLYRSRTERFKKSFFPSTTSMWNNLQVRDRNISTVQAFKRSLLQYFDIKNYNKLYDFAIDRFAIECCTNFW
jgi:hypothetical protein